MQGLAALAAAEPVEVRSAWRPQLRDPGEEMVLEAAAKGRADALVKHNLAGFPGASPRFGLPLLPPAGLLERTGTRAGQPAPSSFRPP